MRSALLRLAAVALCAAAGASALPTPALAQAPKKFEWYENTSDLGFRIKVPEGWDLIPPNPGETQMIAEFSHPTQYQINVGPGDVLYLYGWLVKFDRRPNAQGERPTPKAKNVHDWIKGKDKTGATTWSLVSESPLKGVAVPAVEYVFEGPNREGPNRPTIRCYASVYTISDDLQVAMVYNGPEGKSWRKYGSAFETMAKSFQPMAIERIAADTGPGAGSIRSQKRQKLIEHVAQTPGWRLLETPNYFVVSNNDDQQFLDELLERLEAIRAVYEEQYPPSKARRARTPAPAEEPEAGSDEAGAPGGEDGAAEPGPDGDRSVSVQADPLERSRTSVVRVTATREQYMDYGGPGGSAGYWASFHEELVVFDDKAVRGRDFTWLVLNHEAFHQYIFYFYGNLAPHSWYNEGTGDYFSGFEYKRKRFQEGKSSLRERDIQQMLREGRYAPLKEFVRWTQAEYLGSNSYDLQGPECYAQGWSLIWFLRTGKKNKAPGWNDDWNDVLDVYLATLAETGDLDKAVDEAFAGIDWTAFEASWKKYIE